MRIGEFCKQFNVSASTVRYYIHRGMLIPEIHNRQYLFSENCNQDMQKIIELKALRFSLDEIHRLLTLHRKFNLAQKADAESYLYMLYQQKKRLTRLLERSYRQEALLKQIQEELMLSSTDQ